MRKGWLFALSVLVIGSFGIYIGRYLRYNSWDVVADPYYLTKDIIEIFLQPHNHKTAFGMTMGMSIFLISTYYAFKMMLKPSKS